jgi:hypothetical protein
MPPKFKGGVLFQSTPQIGAFISGDCIQTGAGGLCYDLEQGHRAELDAVVANMLTQTDNLTGGR